MANKKVRCCGISFHDSPTTILKSFLLHVPSVYLLASITAVFLLIRVLLRRRPGPSLMLSLLTAQYGNIKNASLSPRFRCVVASRLYHLSPRLSGVVFRSFNFVLLTTFWCLLIPVAALAWHFAFWP